MGVMLTSSYSFRRVQQNKDLNMFKYQNILYFCIEHYKFIDFPIIRIRRKMNLYSLTLQESTMINHAVYGNFSGPRKHEILVAKGTMLELLRPEEENGKLHTVYRQDMFTHIRKVIAFRLTGLNIDYAVLGTDSGKLTILEYKEEKERFEVVHQEIFGKTGVRRIVPGEYLAGDPKGRAVMVGAVEKQKFVYVLNRENDEATISSPLEAHKPRTIVFDMCGLDVGYSNPVFA